MAVAEPHQHRRSGGGGFVAAGERLAGFDQREAARRLDPQRFEHFGRQHFAQRSEEHTSELQSLMRISYAVFCLKKKRMKNVRDMRENKRTGIKTEEIQKRARTKQHTILKQ